MQAKDAHRPFYYDGTGHTAVGKRHLEEAAMQLREKRGVAATEGVSTERERRR